MPYQKVISMSVRATYKARLATRIVRWKRKIDGLRRSLTAREKGEATEIQTKTMEMETKIGIAEKHIEQLNKDPEASFKQRRDSRVEGP